jgi:thiamine biosynthesis lipoprotein ApbE
MGSSEKMTRRTFLAAAALAPMGTMGAMAVIAEGSTNEYHYHYDHILGTSMDLVLRTRDAEVANRARNVIIDEILRLNAVLNTRDPQSEICMLDPSDVPSRDLRAIFAAYQHWEHRTGGLLSIRPAGKDSPQNVDALGKAYIIDRAVFAARNATPALNGLLLNIGGDIVSWGNTEEIAVTNPLEPHDNALPLTTLALRNAAVATSGTYERGAHLINGRTQCPALPGVSATVIARDAVTANALATTLCVTDAEEGFRLVEETPGAEALRIEPDGRQQRSRGFARMEKPRFITTSRAFAADWPSGYEMAVTLVLKPGGSAFGGRGGGFGGRGGGRPLPLLYVAVWMENSAGKVVRVLAFWANKPQYYREMSGFYAALGRNQNLLYSLARATRRPGSYSLVWDGLDDQGKPVPPGTYKIVVETNQEHGDYAKQNGTIDCSDMPASLTLPATSNFEPVIVQYGPRQTRA